MIWKSNDTLIIVENTVDKWDQQNDQSNNQKERNRSGSRDWRRPTANKKAAEENRRQKKARETDQSQQNKLSCAIYHINCHVNI